MQLYTRDGVAKTLPQWADELGIKYATLHRRVVIHGFERAVAMGLARELGTLITVDGVSLSQANWAKRLGISSGVLNRRIKSMGAEAAIRYRSTRCDVRAPIAIAIYDQTPRTYPEWAKLCGYSRLEGLRLRETHLGSLEAVVREKFFRVKTCRKGHVVEGDNIQIVLKDGKETERCRRCYSAYQREWQSAHRVRKPKSSLCRAQAHPMAGDNVGTTSRGTHFCRACRAAKTRERVRQKRIGLYEKRPQGLSLDDKLAALCGINPATGCVFWNGSRADRNRPVIHHPSLPTRHAMVRTLMWERKTGKRLPEKHTIQMTCSHPDDCVYAGHMKCIRRRERLLSAEAREKREHTLHVRYSPEREVLMTEAMKHADAIRHSLRRFHQLQHEVEDIVQEAMLRAYRTWTRGVRIADMRSFLLISARRIAVDITRQRSVIVFVSLPEVEDAPVPEFVVPAPRRADPAVAFEHDQEWIRQRAKLFARVRLISRKARRVFLLRAEGLSQKEIAAKMGTSEHTIEQQLRKAYAIVRGRRSNAEPLQELFTGTDD